MSITKPQESNEQDTHKREVRTLAQLAPGECGVVCRVLGGGAIHRRMLDMGICKGVHVEVEREAPLKDPIKIKLRGYALSLRRSEARLIEISMG